MIDSLNTSCLDNFTKSGIDVTKTVILGGRVACITGIALTCFGTYLMKRTKEDKKTDCRNGILLISIGVSIALAGYNTNTLINILR